jgi:transposase
MRTQKSPAAFGFDRYDKGRLQRVLAVVSDKRTFMRLKAVLLVAEGTEITAVAKLFERSIQIIYRWINIYLSGHRPSDLFDDFRSGRPLVAHAITHERILEAIEHNPLHLAYQTTTWTVELLAVHLNSCYDSDITPRTLRRRMKEAGLRFKRPRYVYSEKDPHRTQKKGRLSES